MSCFGVMETGTTKPMKIRGVEQSTGRRGQYIVKFKNATRMDIRATCREVLGLWIGKELDLPMVEPVNIQITPEFVATIKGKDGYNNARNSIGLNVGSVYEEGFQEFIKGNPFSLGILTDSARDIFAFDMFISNADRGAGKPNVLCNGNNFLLFDHELAFSFVLLLPFSQSKTPWILGDGEKEMYRSHYFYPYLKSMKLDFEEFTERFKRINDSFWIRVKELMPLEWQTEDIETIKNYLKAIAENHKIFAKQLKTVLS